MHPTVGYGPAQSSDKRLRPHKNLFKLLYHTAKSSIILHLIINCNIHLHCIFTSAYDIFMEYFGRDLEMIWILVIK